MKQGNNTTYIVAILLAVVLLATILFASPADAQPYYRTDSYVMISQRPDADKAVRCQNAVMAAGCSAFTSSTVNVLFPTRPVQSVLFRVEMTAQHEQDQVRLRAFRWIATLDGWTTEDVSWPAIQPMASMDPPTILLNAPRSVGYLIDPEWWQEQQGQWTFVLEFVGSPTIFSAQIIQISQEP